MHLIYLQNGTILTPLTNTKQCNTREIKLDVTWSYVKRQTAKMKLFPSVLSSLNSRVKIFVLVANSRRNFSIFMWFNEGLDEKNTNSEVIFAVCRLTKDQVTSSLIPLLFYFYGQGYRPHQSVTKTKLGNALQIGILKRWLFVFVWTENVTSDFKFVSSGEVWRGPEC